MTNPTHTGLFERLRGILARYNDFKTSNSQRLFDLEALSDLEAFIDDLEGFPTNEHQKKIISKAMEKTKAP